MWWWLVVLALPQAKGGHVCPVTCTNGLLAFSLKRCPRHLLRYLWTPARGHKVWTGLLFTSTAMAAKTPVPSMRTVGICKGPGKHDKAGRRNFPLTQEIGTSYAAKQSNHLAYFTDHPAWHMLATKWYFVFRSTITHSQKRPQPFPSTSSTGLTKRDCCYVLQDRGFSIPFFYFQNRGNR